ncbi:hypothetical protein P152DRAFT_496270 [Eremomyces bilateralis CBS 781.70]|uniref:Tc1-like transposase DDE domain-containing protein n=1 Tax=Eremomyces bilateralis CBS 781.70 TaxID=1392243 RepID=A0A6G1GC91_9PEZI|nr:uncharacterized protein P152DRAFT_496270 [Eremomyces bilateralis CBS 781.70]KAF1815643.1 hypothetical protein P152DRAFT_496270 [Eremomyces bilateralis CBS 781.70]
MIIRRPGERYCPQCVQRQGEVEQNAKNNVHVWGAVGYNFKSDLVTYDVPSNTTGEMAQQTYIDSILDPIVNPWIQNGHDFVLEEEQDSGHGPPRARGNIVKEWKSHSDHRLEHYFNCAGSPDLTIVEDAFQPMKQHVRKFTHWEPDEMQQLLKE